jgi:Fic family protein
MDKRLSKDIGAIDTLYKPFRSFKEWAAATIDLAQWDARCEQVRRLASDDSEVLSRALEAAKRAAAIETGAIEGLYDLDRGVTITIATQSAMWDAALRDKGEARSLIESQLRAYEHVLDFATTRTPLAETWIRELHSVLCGAQQTYKVHTDAGLENRPLPIGVYKTSPNHVKQIDDSLHAYAPVSETAPEMARLVAELNSAEFGDAHPALQAAYAHHALVAIHPFQDGNGRVARALASVFTYRGANVPVLILSEAKLSYLDALAQADDGDFQPFVDFVFRSSVLALELVDHSLAAARVLSPLEAARLARQLNYTRGGFAHGAVDEAGVRLLDEVQKQLIPICDELRALGGLVCKVSPRTAVTERVKVPVGYRVPLAMGESEVTAVFRLEAPANAQVQVHFRFFVPIDCGEQDEIMVRCLEQGSAVRSTYRDAHPQCSLGAQIKVRLWLDAVVGTAMQALRSAGADNLVRTGHHPARRN